MPNAETGIAAGTRRGRGPSLAGAKVVHPRLPRGAQGPRKAATVLPDLGGPVPDGAPVLPAILASLAAFPPGEAEALRRCLGLGVPAEPLARVGAEAGLGRASMAYRLGVSLRTARRSFAWAADMEARALDRVGMGRVPVREIAQEPWAAGIAIQALEIMLPRITGEALRLRGRSPNGRLCRRGVLLGEA